MPSTKPQTSKTPKQRHSTPGRKKRDIASELTDVAPVAPIPINPHGNSKLREDVVGKLKQAFAIDATVEEACFYAGIHKDTYYEWKKQYPILSDELEGLRHTPILTARQIVVNALKSDPDMALKYLERKRKKEFSTKIENEHTLKELPKPIIDIGLEPPKEDEDE